MPDLPRRGMGKELQVGAQGSSSRQGAAGDPGDPRGLFPTGLPQNWDSHLRGHPIPSPLFLSPKKRGRLPPKVGGS